MDIANLEKVEDVNWNRNLRGKSLRHIPCNEN